VNLSLITRRELNTQNKSGRTAWMQEAYTAIILPLSEIALKGEAKIDSEII